MELRDALTLAIMVPSVSKPEGGRRGGGGQGRRKKMKPRGEGFMSERNGKDKN